MAFAADPFKYDEKRVFERPKRRVDISVLFMKRKLAEYDNARGFFKRLRIGLFGDRREIESLRNLIATSRDDAILDDTQLETLQTALATAKTKPGEIERTVFDNIETVWPVTTVPIAFLKNLLERYDQEKGLLRKWWRGDQADIIELRIFFNGLSPKNRNLTIEEEHQLYKIMSAKKTVPGSLSDDIFAQIRKKFDKGNFLKAVENLKDNKLNNDRFRGPGFPKVKLRTHKSPGTPISVEFLKKLLQRYDQEKRLLRKWWERRERSDPAEIVELRGWVSRLSSDRDLSPLEARSLYDMISSYTTAPGTLPHYIFEQIRNKFGLLTEEHYQILRMASSDDALPVADVLICSTLLPKGFNNLELTTEMKQAIALDSKHAENVQGALDGIRNTIFSISGEKTSEEKVKENILNRFKLIICQNGQYAWNIYNAICLLKHNLTMGHIEKIACSPAHAEAIGAALQEFADLSQEDILAVFKRAEASPVLEEHLLNFAKLKGTFKSMAEEAKEMTELSKDYDPEIKDLNDDDEINEIIFKNITKIGKLANEIYSCYFYRSHGYPGFLFTKENFTLLLEHLENADTIISAWTVFKLKNRTLFNKYKKMICDVPTAHAVNIAKGLANIACNENIEDEKKVIASGEHAHHLGKALKHAHKKAGIDKKLLFTHPKHAVAIEKIMSALLEMKKFDERNKSLLEKLIAEKPEYLKDMGKCLQQLKELKPSEQLQANIDNLFHQAEHCKVVNRIVLLCRWFDENHTAVTPLSTQKNIAALLLLTPETMSGIEKILSFYRRSSIRPSAKDYYYYNEEGNDGFLSGTYFRNNIGFSHNLPGLSEVHFQLICKNARQADHFIKILKLIYRLYSNLVYENPDNIVKLLKLGDHYPAMIGFLQKLSRAERSLEMAFNQEKFDVFCDYAPVPGFLHALDDKKNDEVGFAFNALLKKCNLNKERKKAFFEGTLLLKKKNNTPFKTEAQKAWNDMSDLADKKPLKIILEMMRDDFEKPKPSK